MRKILFTALTTATLAMSQLGNAGTTSTLDKELFFENSASSGDAWFLRTEEKPKSEIQVAGICFKKGETTDGFNKICYYRCLSGTTAITIKATKLCPLNIND